MTEDRRVIEATEAQVKKLTKLYRSGLHADKRFIPIDKLDYDLWLILRSIAGLGASEISTALGKNPPYFKGTPLKVWKEKTGQIIEVTDTSRLRIGRSSERTTREEWEYLTGQKILDVKDKMFIPPEEDHLFANLDGIILPAGGDSYGILECKTTLSYTYESWLNKLPSYYFRQAMAELSVINKHPVFDYAEFGFVEFAIYLADRWEVERLRINIDKDFIEKQNKEATDWYKQYVDGVMPPPESVAEWARTEPMEDSIVEASPQAYKAYEELIKLKKHQKNVEEEREELEEVLKAEFKDSDTMIWQGELISTWKSQNRTTVDSKKLKQEEPKIYDKYSKTTPSRILRVKELTITEY